MLLELEILQSPGSCWPVKLLLMKPVFAFWSSQLKPLDFWVKLQSHWKLRESGMIVPYRIQHEQKCLFPTQVCFHISNIVTVSEHACIFTVGYNSWHAGCWFAIPYEMKKDEATTRVISRGGLGEKVPAAHFTMHTTPNKTVGVVHLAASTSKTSKAFSSTASQRHRNVFFLAVDSFFLADLFISFSDVSPAKPTQ